MKTTYLFMDKSVNGETCLVMGTLEQYKAITIANAKLPMEQRRHFIVDRIPESEGLDVMYIEVDYEHFLGWARQYMAAYRNRQDAKHFTVLSLDAPNPIDEALTMHDCWASPCWGKAMGPHRQRERHSSKKNDALIVGHPASCGYRWCRTPPH